MTITKEELLKIVEEIPDSIEIEELMETLYVRDKIKKGQQDIAEGKYKTHEEVKDLISKW